MMRRSLQRGFTLIELMVVIAIIAILASAMIGISGTTYGGSPNNVSDQLVSTMSLAKLRAVSTRRWHRVELTPTQTKLWQWSNFGMATPSGTCALGPPVVNCWQLISTETIPKNVTIWEASSTVYASGGATPSQNTSLDYNMDFKPDGSSTSGTVFVSDKQGVKQWRVVVYQATGSSYARETW